MQLTIAGLIAAAAAAGVLVCRPEAMPVAGALVLICWFFDRADGLLARRQQTASAWGAWLDANVDELVDVGLHVAVAHVAAVQMAAPWPWLLLVAFLAGKYLLMHGLMTEEHEKQKEIDFSLTSNDLCAPRKHAGRTRSMSHFLRGAYHLPANADVRVHLLLVALMTGYLTAELAVVAVYYNVRWIARYVLVARRLGGTR